MSKIEWTGKTWNAVVGCSLASPGCTNCYAMGMAARIARMNPGLEHYRGLTKTVNGKAVWTGILRAAPDKTLTEPLRRKTPTTWFVNSMSDLFHPDIPDDVIDRVFAVMALCPQHTFQVLTKRSARMWEYLSAGERGGIVHAQAIILSGGKFGLRTPQWPYEHVWLGVSTEDQKRADERIPDLLATPAAVRFVSAEPLLGPIQFDHINGTACLASPASCCKGTTYVDSLRGIQACERAGAFAYPGKTGMPKGLDWIIVGGESGRDARPMHPDWARSIRDQCAAAGVAFFFKQWGAWAPLGGPSEADISAEFARTGASELASIPVASPVCIARNGAVSTWDEMAGMSPRDKPRWCSIAKVGKARAGRLLDGRTHDAMPGGAAAPKAKVPA